MPHGLGATWLKPSLGAMWHNLNVVWPKLTLGAQSLQQKRGILRSKYHRKQQRKKFPKTRSCEPQFLANS